MAEMDIMTEYRCYGPTGDGLKEYSCPYCGNVFTVPDGDPVKCSICQQIRDAPALKPCPFCGSEARIRWSIGGDGGHYLRAICQNCHAETNLCDTATEAAEIWDRRTSVGDKVSGLKINRTWPHRIRCVGRSSETEGMYRCDCDGAPFVFSLPDGEIIDCPLHRSIVNLTRDLKLCPFCEGIAVIERFRNREVDNSDPRAFLFIVHCEKCGIETEGKDKPEDAAESWNKRFEPIVKKSKNRRRDRWKGR